MERVVSTCQQHFPSKVIQVSAHHGTLNSIKINERSLDIASIVTKPVKLPVIFDSIRQEINFYVLRHILDFGRSYRNYDVSLSSSFFLMNLKIENHTLRAAISMFLSSAMDAEFMISISVSDLAHHFDIPSFTPLKQHLIFHVEEPNELLLSMQKVMNESGQILQSLHLRDFGIFALKHMDNLFVAICSVFPAFRDVHKIDGQGNATNSNNVCRVKVQHWLLNDLDF